MPIDSNGSKIASLLRHEVPMAALFLSLPFWSPIAELICAYPGEELNWHCIVKEIRWDQIFERAWGLPGCVKKSGNFSEGLDPAAAGCGKPQHRLCILGEFCRADLYCHAETVAWLLP